MTLLIILSLAWMLDRIAYLANMAERRTIERIDFRCKNFPKEEENPYLESIKRKYEHDQNKFS